MRKIAVMSVAAENKRRSLMHTSCSSLSPKSAWAPHHLTRAGCCADVRWVRQKRSAQLTLAEGHISASDLTQATL
jgi:hypothetical protein